MLEMGQVCACTYGHASCVPVRTNMYTCTHKCTQRHTGSDLAIIYNDASVLENHHAAATFGLLQDQRLNVMSELDPDQRKEARRSHPRSRKPASKPR